MLPHGTNAITAGFPGTSCLATFIMPLRDKNPSPLATQPELSPHRKIEAVVLDLEADFLRHMLHGIILGQYVSKDALNPFAPAYLDQARQEFSS
jgi:hypothetical protein